MSEVQHRELKIIDSDEISSSSYGIAVKDVLCQKCRAVAGLPDPLSRPHPTPIKNILIYRTFPLQPDPNHPHNYAILFLGRGDS